MSTYVKIDDKNVVIEAPDCPTLSDIRSVMRARGWDCLALWSGELGENNEMVGIHVSFGYIEPVVEGE